MNIEIQNNRNSDDDVSRILSMIHIPWQQSKEDIWKDMMPLIQEHQHVPVKRMILNWQIAVAAVFVGVFGLGIFMYSHTRVFTSGEMQLANIELPDHSTIRLNSHSEVSYKPYWWWANREVKLQGEAFFKVEKGDKFRVESANGSTEVLGTSFYVLSQGQDYEVICVTGKVKVQAAITKHSVILHPAQKAILQNTGQLQVEENVETENVFAPNSNRLVFTSKPLAQVFKEIENQFGIVILLKDVPGEFYTGSFEKSEKIDDILYLICRPFDLKVKKTSDKHFLVYK